MVRSLTSLACLALGAAVAVSPAVAQSTLAPATIVTPGSPEAGLAPTAYAKPNHDFQTDVRELNAVQLKLTSVAERRGSPKVQAFAKQVREAFTGGKSGLRGVSDDKGVPIVGTAALTREHDTLLAQLGADTADVDRLFADYEVLMLKEALGLVQPYATGGTDARWREAAAEAVSEDQTLLVTARTLQQP